MGSGRRTARGMSNAMGSYLTSVKRKYEVNRGGTFGVLRSLTPRKRVVAYLVLPNPERSAKAFYRLAKVYGAATEQTVSKNGDLTFTAFFTRDSKVVFRPKSSSDGSPTVTIFQAQPSAGIVPYQHLHFERSEP